MMEKINTALNKLANTGQFKKRYDHLKDEVLSDPDIVLYLNENSSTVTNEMVLKKLLLLLLNHIVQTAQLLILLYIMILIKMKLFVY